MIHICPFVREDTPAIADVILSIQRNEFNIPITLEAHRICQTFPLYLQRSGNFWVAEANRTVVGTVGLLDIGSKQAALRKMFVAASYRDKEHGVAQLPPKEDKGFQFNAEIPFSLWVRATPATRSST